MKLENIKDVKGFFEVVDKCSGKIELISPEGDRLNLKSKLCQFIAFTNLFGSSEINSLELITENKEDATMILEFMTDQKK